MAKRPVLPKRNRRASVLAEGFRPLTKAELVKLGRSPTSRAFTTQKPGVKRLDPSKVFSRRRVEQYGALLGPKPAVPGLDYGSALRGTTFERLAESRAQASLGRSPMSTYNRALAAYAEKHDLSRGQARSDPEFRRLYRNLRKESRKRGPTLQRLEALHEFGYLDDDDYERYVEAYT